MADYLTPERHAQIQETADKMRITIYVMPDGHAYHLKRDEPLPTDAVAVFKPSKPWVDPNHGESLPRPTEDSSG